MRKSGLGRSERARLTAAALLLFGLIGYVAARFEVTTDIVDFLPDGEGRVLASLSREIADSELSRTMILTLEASDLASALRASRAFEAALRRDERLANAIAFLEGGPMEGLERALFELYEPRRLFFLAPDALSAQERTSDAGLREAAVALRRELAGPLALLATRVAPRDPFLSLPGIFRRLERTRGGELQIVDDRFVASDDRTAVLFLATRASALDARAQAPVLAAVEEAFRAIEPAFPDGLRLEQSGVNRFATRAATAIEADVRRVSSLSSLLACLLVGFLFRSLRLLVLGAIPVATGVLAGAAAVLWVFGRLHGVTLAFGAALIGVAIDYVVHFYCHHTIASPERDPRDSLRTIVRPLTTGAVTTLAGFVALSGSTLSGLREVACFSAAGILVAFGVTLLVVPLLMPREVRPVAARARLARQLERGFRGLAAHRRAVVCVPVAVVLFAAFALPHARLEPGLADLGQLDADLLAEDERVREKVARTEQMRFVVALGADEAAALAVNDRVAERLDAAILAGELDGQRSLAPLLPAPTTQLAVARVATRDPTFPDRFRRVFREAGFAQDAFEPYLASLAAPLPAPLTYDDLLASPIGPMLRPFRIRLADRVAFLTYLQGVRDADALALRIGDLPDATLLRQADLFRETQTSYLKSTVSLLGVGLAAIAALLALRYRDARRTFATLVPALFAVLLTVSILAATDRGIDLISLTTMLFVVSMGVDYSVFLVDAHDGAEPPAVAAALMSALLACVSTVGAFGMLALSEHPVLANLGLAAAVGITSSLVLAPVTLVLLTRKGVGR